MKSLKTIVKIEILMLIVLGIDAVTNFLYIINFIPKWCFELGIIITIICCSLDVISVLIYLKNKEKILQQCSKARINNIKHVNTYLLYILLIVGTLFIFTYIIALFTK